MRLLMLPAFLGLLRSCLNTENFKTSLIIGLAIGNTESSGGEVIVGFSDYSF